jgi:hypothetical protein
MMVVVMVMVITMVVISAVMVRPDPKYHLSIRRRVHPRQPKD